MKRKNKIHIVKRKFTRAVFAALFMLCPLLQLQAQDKIINPSIVYEGMPRTCTIGGLNVKGIKGYEDFVLLGISGLEIGQEITLPGKEITEAVKRYWKNGLFSDVAISADSLIGDQVYLTVHLKQRPRISEIRYYGIKKSEREDMEEKLGMMKGSQITPNMKDRAKILAKKYFDDKGFKNAEITIEEIEDVANENQVFLDVTIDKKEKTKGKEIIFEGNDKVTTKMMKGSLIKKGVLKKLHEAGKFSNIFSGKKFTDEKLKEDKENILKKYSELGYRDAEIVKDSVWNVDDKNERYTKAVVTADNPVEGFALRIKDISKAADNARCVDNIACSWKAPGAATFESVYENDFSTRRYRTLSPDGTKTFGYAPVEQSVISDRFSYVANDTWNKSLDKTTPLLPEPAAADPQPVGYDGWRRSNKSGTATAAVVKWDVSSTGADLDAEKGGNVLKVCGGSSLGENNFVYAFAPLGETVANGVLTCSVDVKTPSEWAPSSLSRYDIGVMLANAAAYEQGYNGNFAFRCGITGNPPSPDTKKSKRFEPYTNTETGWAPEDDQQYRLISNTWYRVEMTVNLDDRSAGASFKLWEIGENSQARSFVPSVLKFEKTGIPFRNTVDGIGSIGLFASGAGAPTSKKTFIAFDNIVVTKNVGTADETVVYQNVFSTRTRTFDNVGTGRLVGTINIDDGADHWIRRAAGTGPCCIMDADNPCVAAWADGDSGSYAVHSLGKAVKSGSFRADIRPPSFWASRDASSRIASAVLGGDRFLQGCPSGSSAFTTAFSAITFGFTDTANAKDQFGVCSNVQVYAWNGNGTGRGQR